MCPKFGCPSVGGYCKLKFREGWLVGIIAPEMEIGANTKIRNNEKRTNFGSLLVGLEPVTSVYEIFMRSILPSSFPY